MKSSTKTNWDSFWEKKQQVEDVYANSSRVKSNLEKVTTIAGKKILEIGAGTGRDSFYFAEENASLFLLDYSQNSLQIIKKLIPDRMKIFAIGGDAFSLPLPDESVDVVFHQGLLEHFRHEQAEKLLDENIRVLKKGGLLLVDVPQRYHIYTGIKHILIWMNAWFAGWEREFSIKELAEIFRRKNLTVLHSYGEWMYPSLFYRMLREVFLRVGIKLPLKPKSIPVLSGIRASIRNFFDGSSIQKNTALSIGVIARK